MRRYFIAVALIVAIYRGLEWVLWYDYDGRVNANIYPDDEVSRIDAYDNDNDLRDDTIINLDTRFPP